MADIAIVDSPPPAPPPAPTSTIRVSEMAQTGSPAPPPKEGTARSRMFEDLRKKVKPEGAPAEGTARPAADAANRPGAADPNTEPPPDEGTAGEGATADPNAAPPAAGGSADKKRKVNPWKLAEEYKGKVSSLENEIAALKTSGLPQEAKKEFLSRIEKLEAENKKLEDHIQFVDFSKSKEFADKYQAPYDAAWKRAASELVEIPVTDPTTGEARAATPDDLLALVNMPLGQALSVAKEKFGDYAEYVMAHRGEIRKLFDQQAEALENAKKSGAERQRQNSELVQKRMAEVKGKIAETWKAANEAATKHEVFGKFFAPVENDIEGNGRLEKGLKLVDQAFSENPMDPRLTPEQRAEVVKRHAAVRYRAAAFSRVHQAYQKTVAELTALKAELAKYKSSTPPAGGSTPPPAASGPGSARDQVFSALRAKAK